MTVELPDGTIVPSFLGVKRGGVAGNSGMQTNLALRMGEVKAIVYPDDPKSVSGTFIEYNVFVQHQDGSSPGVGMFYNNCLMVNVLGGVSDKVQYTLRAASTQNNDSNKLIGDGSKVLILCINGATHNAIILGGIRTPVTSPAGGDVPDSRANGHNYYFSFNGAQITVDNDGQLELKFQGATNADDTLAEGVDPDASGSTLLFSKDGSIIATSPDGKQVINIDHANGLISIDADSELDLKCSGPVNIVGTGVNIGAANNAMLLASNYRFAEALMNLQLVALATQLSSLMATVGANMAAAASALPTPMVGPMIAAAPMAAASAGMLEMAPLMAEWAAAIAALEAQAQTFLSAKNFND